MNIILNVCKYFFISAAIITAYFWCDEMLKNGLSQKKLYIYAKAFLIFLILIFVANASNGINFILYKNSSKI